LALEHAAAEGARTGALTNDDRLVRSSIAAAAAPLDAGKVDVVIDPPEAQRGSDPRGTLMPRAPALRDRGAAVVHRSACAGRAGPGGQADGVDTVTGDRGQALVLAVLALALAATTIVGA